MMNEQSFLKMQIAGGQRLIEALSNLAADMAAHTKEQNYVGMIMGIRDKFADSALSPLEQRSDELRDAAVKQANQRGYNND